MKRIIGTAVAAAVVVGAALVAPAVATAVPSNVVTSAEFNKVAYGNSIDYVRKTFGTNGTVVDRLDVPGTVNDSVSVEFPTYYDEGFVQVDFARRSSGAWYLVTKYAYWGVTATRTADKATEAEFAKVAQGNSIAYVRSAFGTNGTVTETYDAPGTAYDSVVVEWPTASVDGWVQVYFAKSSSGTWKVDTRSAFWGVAPKQTADKATEAEFNKVKLGNSIEYARSTFGTAGTISFYYDAPGTADDMVSIGWPTAAPDGSVDLDFVKSSSGAWKVDGRSAYWARTATPTTDLATQAEFEKLGKGSTLDEARSTFGTAGTVVATWDGPGTDSDLLVMAWYAGTEGGDVTILFGKTTAGVWTILDDADMTPGIWPGGATARSFSDGQESREPSAPLHQEAPARPTWDLRDAG